jgi:hypothetical protein
MKGLFGLLAVLLVSSSAAIAQKSQAPMTIVGAATPAPAKAAPSAQPASQAYAVASASSSQLLTNSSVIQMKNAGMSDALIISTIHTQPGNYAVALNDLLALRKVGITDSVIIAMQEANAAAANAPAPPHAGAEAPDGKPRVYVFSASHGNTWGAVRDQTIEVTRDLQRDCPAVQVTINQGAADYSVALNHIEVGLVLRDNQMEITDRTGDVIGRISDGGSIAKGAKKTCAQIIANWGSTSGSTQRAAGH